MDIGIYDGMGDGIPELIDSNENNNSHNAKHIENMKRNLYVDDYDDSVMKEV